MWQEKELALFGQRPGTLTIAAAWKTTLLVDNWTAALMSSEQRLLHLQAVWPSCKRIATALWAQKGVPLAVSPDHFELPTLDRVPHSCLLPSPAYLLPLPSSSSFFF